MGKEYLIDSNVIIGYLDNKLPPKGMNLMHPIIDAVPKISVINKIEVLRFNGSIEAQEIIENFVKECVVFDLNETVVERTIAICRSRKIKLPDAIIAATASVNDFILITRNAADFTNIKGLNILNPWE